MAGVASSSYLIASRITLCGLVVAAAAALLGATPLPLLIESWWDDEDNPFSGALLGSPGVLRVRLLRNGERGEGSLVLAADLEALTRQAVARFSVAVELVTASGEMLRTIEVEGKDGSLITCIAPSAITSSAP